MSLTEHIQVGLCLYLVIVGWHNAFVDSFMPPLYICNDQYLASVSMHDEIVCWKCPTYSYCFHFCGSFSSKIPLKSWYERWTNRALKFHSPGLIGSDVTRSVGEIEYCGPCIEFQQQWFQLSVHNVRSIVSLTSKASTLEAIVSLVCLNSYLDHFVCVTV